MAQSFAELLKNRKQQTEALTKRIENDQKRGFDNDPDARFYTLKHLKNADGNGRATFRFLPPPMGEQEPFALYFGYAQKNKLTNKWYWHNSHQSFDKDAFDPAYEYNGKIYSNAAISKEDKQKLTFRRQKHYIANILIVDDPTEPENNGKVFLFDFGPMIYKLIQNRLKPNPEVDEWKEGADAFDPIEGCDFKLKIVSKKVNGDLVPSYDTSTWAEPSPMAKSEKEMEAIWKKCYSLKEFTDPENKSLYKPIERQIKDLAAYLGEAVEGPKETKEPAKAKSKAPKEEKSVDNDDTPPWDEDDESENESEKKLIDEDDEDDFFSKFK